MTVAKIFTGDAKAANELSIYQHILENLRLNMNSVHK